MDMFDFNTAEAGRDPTELIPANTVAILLMKLRPGGQGPGGWLKAGGDTGQILMLDVEFTVMGGPFNKRKFWGLYVVQADSGATEGQQKAAEISRSLIRGVIESARGVLPAADDAASMAKRKISGWGDLDGMVLCGKIGIEQGSLKDKQGPPNGERYADKNKLVCAVTPDSRLYVSPSDPEAAAAAAAHASSAQNFNGAGQQSGAAVQQAQNAVQKPAWAN